MVSRAGSHAGRGFRYQDAVAACLALHGWAGHSSYGLVIPEGDDDVELLASSGRILAQVKSRRGHRGPFPIGEIVGFLTTLWNRTTEQPEDSYLLILEREPAAWPNSKDIAWLHELTVLMAALPPGVSSELLDRTRIYVLPNPRWAAHQVIEARRECSALEADAYYGVVLLRAGNLADANGMRKSGGFLGLSPSDVELEINTLAPMFTSARIQAALSRGLCEAVDFSTPLEEADFFSGVDVQPGHVVAGLLVERTVLRESVVTALTEHRNILLKGPSGAGKSGLQWDVAYSLRHSMRWFRVRRLAVEDIVDLVALANNCCASVDAPVGFLMDNLGAGLMDGWDALAREVAIQPSLALLASIREEDIYPLVERHKAVEVRVRTDEDFAEQFWRELRERDKTEWTNWLEPWTASRGLLLEYAHILTKGSRLDETLRQQVAVRATDSTRHIELEILGLCAAVTSIGARVDVARLPEVLGRSAIEIGTSLPRIVNEHLMRDLGDGSMGGAHELRSQHLLGEIGHISLRAESETFELALGTVLEADIGIFLARTLERHPVLEDALLDAIAEKLVQRPSARLMTVVLNGLGEREIAQVIDAWLSSPEVAEVPLSQISLVALFGTADVELPDLPEFKLAASAIRLMAQMKAQSTHSSLRGRLLRRLSISDLQRMLEQVNDIATLNTLLVAHVGHALTPTLRDALMEMSPGLLAGELSQVSALLGTAHVLDPEVAAQWVSKTGELALLRRIGSEVPWATEASVQSLPEGLAAICDIRTAPARYQPDPHGSVVTLCELLLALCPAADLAIARAVTVSGELLCYGGMPVADKKIPRSNLPPNSLPAWNRRWGNAIAARLAPESYGAYLGQAADDIKQLNSSLFDFFDGLFRNSPSSAALEILGNVHERSRSMPSPNLPWFAKCASGESVGVKTSNLQQILFDCSTDMVRRFVRLPADSQSYIGWIASVLKRIQDSIELEPWQITAYGTQAKAALESLATLIDDLRALAGDGLQRGMNPAVMYRRLRAPKGQALTEARASARKRAKSGKALKERDLQRLFRALTSSARVYVKSSKDELLMWPLLEVLVTFELEQIQRWPSFAHEGWAIWRSLIENALHLTVMPVVNGMCVPMCAIGGHSEPFPSEPKAWEWIHAVGLRAVPEIASRMWGIFSDAVMDVAALEAQGFGLDNSPEIELLARIDARARLRISKASIDERLPTPLRIMTDSLVELVDQQPWLLYNAQLAALRGEIDEIGEILMDALYTCYSVDLRATPTLT
ncbi:dsDNA nuclease domain-containing protein [Pseudomonas syringae USA007]|uniref:DsDNA nuclease domain-containing protein n=1 Tax=Pseudomonas syringae USA007 TaxID=1357288 RepID=A0AAU8M9U4_PSESX|nr:dsDNA nuclease domain-containing protein [Pseudomonas syringae]